MTTNSFTLTIFFEGQWWVGIFERTTPAGYSVARHIFGPEPSDVETHEFVLKHTDELRFSTPSEETESVIRKKNPKRLNREVRKLQSKQPNLSKAQDSLRIELEKNKKEKKSISSKMKEERKQRQFELKQEKKKEKHKGH